MGRDIYAVRDAKTGQMRKIDPATGSVGEPVPGGEGAPYTSPGPTPFNKPAPPGAPGVSAPSAAPNAGGTVPAGFTPVADTLPEGMEPPPGPNTRDDNFLAQVKAENPQLATTIKGLADYETNPASLSIRGNRREQVLGMAKQYDSSYDQTLYPAKQRAVTEFFAGGPMSPAGTLTAGNTAILHLGELDGMVNQLRGQPGVLNSIADKVGAAGIPFLSYAANEVRNKAVLGTPEGAALSAFTTARQRFSEEVTKFYAGSQGSEAERDRAIQVLDAAKSPEELHQAIKTDVQLMRDKVMQMQGRLIAAMGPGSWKAAVTRDPSLVLTYKNSRDVANRILGTGQLGSPQGNNTAPPAAAAPAVRSPADVAALNWANANPSDPRAAAIKQRLGVQ